MKTFSKLQENSKKQFNELRSKIDVQKEYFTKKLKII